MSRYEVMQWVPEGTSPPITTRDLLKRMDVLEASREHQEAAVAAWLSCHELNPILRQFLRDDGFLPGDPDEGVV